MAITLAKFSTNEGEPLGADQLDNNWQIIEDALNAAGAQQLYSIVAAGITNQGEKDGSNNAALSAKIKLVTPPALNPVLRMLVTLNGLIVAAFETSSYYMGGTFPFVAGQTGGEAFDTIVNIPAISYPATIKVYVWDENSNYAAPVTILIQDNPCLTPAESIVLNSAVAAAGVLTLNLDITNGSNDFKAQYFDGAAWQDLDAFVQVDGAGVVVTMNEAITGAHDVRVIDTLTLNTSNSINVNLG